LYNPSILILDEATSSIDSESEMLIQHAIDKLIKDRTSIVIAHRLSTIRKADKIMVLDKGIIKEMGTHNELMNLQGHYFQLHKMQFEMQEAGSLASR
jgi:ATP-binding cassette subfamily B protein